MQMFCLIHLKKTSMSQRWLVDVSDFNGGEVKVVGHKGDDFATIGIQRLHQPQLAWIKFLGFRDHKSHDIVGTDGGRLVVTVKNPNYLELHVVLRTHDKESTGKIHSPHLLEINVGFVRRVNSSRLVSDEFQHVTVVPFPVRDVDLRRDTSPQVQQRMHLNSAFRVFP